MPDLKNLCAHIPTNLYARVSTAKTMADQTISEYVTYLLTEYYEWKDSGGKIMARENEKTRTLAFQVSENLFQRIKKYLEMESVRTGQKLSQKEFVIGLIEAALDEAEREDAEERRISGDDAGETGDAGESLSGGENSEENAETGQDSSQSGEGETPDAARIDA